MFKQASSEMEFRPRLLSDLGIALYGEADGTCPLRTIASKDFLTPQSRGTSKQG